MKLKAVPEPRGIEFLDEAQRALPLVPGSENDCCARLLDRTDLAARDDAREWITFLRALGLAAETDSGYRRLRRDPNREELATAFREGVFGADTLLDGLPDDEPLDETEAFEGFRSHIPNWERHRRPDWEDHWRERVRRLLGWLVLFDLAERVDDGYRVV
ncbi:hypothetical protein [Halococcus sediminicola]|uniref:hypothetical protein n=1 Tax=Halococcus sediminicola TaxID=1264579 RepID=UPI000679E157|nr:hypothetical protein [Halococcus sediminicola]